MKKIAIAGNPNCGKTTLFNALTGSNQKIGNWPGVTVEQIKGQALYNSEKFEIIDLPGTYSLSAYSEDEQVARDFLLSGEADLVVNIVDASNLEQNLYLTTQLIEMKIPLVILINRNDIALRRKISIDVDLLEKKLGCPVEVISAIKQQDIEKAQRAIFNNLKIQPPTAIVEYPDEIEHLLDSWQKKLNRNYFNNHAPLRWNALKLLENDTTILIDQNIIPIPVEIRQTAVKKIEKIHKEDIDIIIADYRYGFVHGLCVEVVQRVFDRKELTDKIDNIVLNRFLGIPIFLVIMYFTFQVAINFGGIFIDFFDILFGGIFVDGSAALLTSWNAPQLLITIISNGAATGIQTVATFIPIIFFMFFMLAILEDSGYMARAAFVMDRFMRIIGLPGKSFVPMVVGFGCTVPAIMGGRILENRRDKLFTIFLTPFMSCGARLPVYVLFATAFFPNQAGLLVFSLYLSGIAAAALTGILLKKTIFKGSTSNFIMELPTYSRPRLKHILIHTWVRLKEFIAKAGILITIAVTLLSLFNTFGFDGSTGNENSERSILAQTAMIVTPLLEPMGVERENWPATVALITGIFAKESVIGTLNALYTQGESSLSSQPYSIIKVIGDAFLSIKVQLFTFSHRLIDPFGFADISESKSLESSAKILETEKSIFAKMRERFSKGPLQAFAYLLFILLYIPCVGAIGALYKETGNLIASIILIYTTLLAWVSATLFYQFTIAHSLFYIGIAFTIILAVILSFILLSKFYYKDQFLEEDL